MGKAKQNKEKNLQNQFLSQLSRFYENKLGKFEIFSVGQTPEILQRVGAKPLLVQMTQSTLRKVIRKPDLTKSVSAHGLTKEIVETIPDILKAPALIVKDVKRNSLALISSTYDYQGIPILLALKLETKMNGIYINEIKSIYGKTNLVEYLQKQSEDNVVVADMKKAKQISRDAGLQLPAAWKLLD